MQHPLGLVREDEKGKVTERPSTAKHEVLVWNNLPEKELVVYRHPRPEQFAEGIRSGPELPTRVSVTPESLQKSQPIPISPSSDPSVHGVEGTVR